MQGRRNHNIPAETLSGEDVYSRFSLSSPHSSVSAGNDEQTSSLPPPADTPPENPTVEPENVVMPNGAAAISQTFYPGARFSEHPQDIFLMSEDKITFCVSCAVLDQASNNHFALLLSHPPSKNQVIHVVESSQVLNVLLHALYSLPLASPPLELIVTALARFPTYGIDPKAFIKPSTPLYTYLVSYAALYPMDIYVLAASYNLHDLAVSTSAYLLSFPLTTITNELAECIGSYYLNRLVQLHLQRIATLKSLLAIAPRPHPDIPCCNLQDQRSVTRAWNLVSTYLLWDFDASADMSPDRIQTSLHSLTDELSCEYCKNAVFTRVKDIIVQWSLAKRTIS